MLSPVHRRPKDDESPNPFYFDLNSVFSLSLRSLFLNGWIRQHVDAIIIDIENTIENFIGICFIHLKSAAVGKILFMAVDRRHTLWDISQFLAKASGVGLGNSRRIRLKLPFVCLKDIYPIKTENMEVTAEDIEEMNVDPNRWVELPNDYEMYFTVGDIEERTMKWNQSDHIEIAVDYDLVNISGDNQRSPQRLQVGSIVNVQAKHGLHGGWYESVIRYIRFEDREEEDDYITAHVYVHYIGCKVEWDEIKTVELLTKDSLIESMEEEGFLPRGMKTTGPKCWNNYVVNPEHSINVNHDSTLGGVIHWRKVAELSALMSRDIKMKVWNEMFKTEQDYHEPECKRMSKVLQTFVMLSLTKVKSSI